MGGRGNHSPKMTPPAPVNAPATPVIYRNGSDALTYNRSKAAEAIGALPEDERKAVRDYTGSWFRAINTILRKGDGPEVESTVGHYTLQDAKKKIPLIDRAFKRPTSKLGDNMILHRAMNWSDFGDKVARGEIGVGSSWTDKGFTSTAATKGGWGGNVQMRIRAPKGISALHINGKSAHPAEEEVLLNRGTSFRILSLRKSGDKWEVEVEAYRG